MRSRTTSSMAVRVKARATSKVKARELARVLEVTQALQEMEIILRAMREVVLLADSSIPKLKRVRDNLSRRTPAG